MPVAQTVLIRILIVIRYTGDATNEPALFPADWTGRITGSTNLMGRLSTLLPWHRADPPDDRELQRNDRVFDHWQHNRNPFIDHPGWGEPAFAAELQISHLAFPTSHFALSWPAVFTNAVPETAASFPAAWFPVTNAATFTGSNWLLVLPENTGPAFYHLQLR